MPSHQNVAIKTMKTHSKASQVRLGALASPGKSTWATALAATGGHAEALPGTGGPHRCSLSGKTAFNVLLTVSFEANVAFWCDASQSLASSAPDGEQP